MSISIPSFEVSDIQKQAYQAFKTNTAFASPLLSPMTDITNSMSSIGGMPTDDLAKLWSLEKYVGDNPDFITIKQQLSSIGADGGMLAELQSGVSAAAGAVGEQAAAISSGVVNGVNFGSFGNIISAGNSYESMRSSFGDAMDGAEEGGLCDGIKSLFGSLSGALDSAMSAINQSIGALAAEFSKIADGVKSALAPITAVIGSVMNAAGQLVGDITAVLSQAAGMVQSFVAGVASTIGAGIRAAMDAAHSAISSATQLITDTIRNELAMIGEMFDRIKAAAMALSLPSLNPCAKDVVRNLAGAAGASSVVDLVSV